MTVDFLTGEILDNPSDFAPCLFCGRITRDWWHIDRESGFCRCHACYDKGIAETQEETNRHANKFVLVKNRDFYNSVPLVQTSPDENKLVSSDNFYIIRFAPQGTLIEFSPRLGSSGRSRPSLRGDVTSFSVRSRSRLNKNLAMVNRSVLPLFVTLTYHLEYPLDFEGYKYHLHHFLISLSRAFPRAGVMWKLEFQERGAPHYHLFVWGVSLEDLRSFVPDTWYKIAGAGSAYHLAWHKGELGNEHCVQAIKSWNGVKYYASKYFSKIDDTISRGGRIWGKSGSHVVLDKSGKKIKVSNIPFSKILEFRVNLSVALEFRQALSRQMNFEFQRLGFWCGNFEVDWLIYLYELITADLVSSHPPDDFPDWDLDDFPNDEFLQEGGDFALVLP